MVGRRRSPARSACTQQRTADHALLAQTQLQRALNSRVIIEQAKGFLAHTHQIDMDAAFRLLRRYARTNQMRIAEAARAVVNDGALGTTSAPDDAGR